MRRRELFFAIMLLSVLSGITLFHKVARAGELPGESNDTGYSSILYNSTNGLPTSEANAVVQTSDGFIWIGCYGGLIRYDGNKFYRFDSTTGITSVGCLFVDSKDRLWVGTNDRGIALYKEGSFQLFGKEQGLESGSVKRIIEDENGNILIATTCGVSYIDKNLQVQTIKDTQISTKYINDLDGNSDGDIVGITLDGDVFFIHNLRVNEFYENTKLKFPKVRSVDFESRNSEKIYFGTEEDSIVKMELSGGINQYRVMRVNQLASINKVVKQSSGELWVCADNGIGYFKGNGKFVSVNGVAMNNSVDDMMIDYEGNFWFTSSRQGVMKIVENRFYNISLAAGLPEMVVNTTCMYREELYIGSDTGLYLLDSNNKSIHNELTKRLAGIRIRCIKEDSKGDLWICTYGSDGLLKYNQKGEIICFNPDNGLNSDRVRSIIEDSKGNMIVAGCGGVNLIQNDKIVASYGSKDGIVNTEILTVCEGDNGILYAGSDGGGIYVIDNGKVSCMNDHNGLESDVILRIKKDPQLGIYWIITGNSIAYMKNNKITTLHNFPYGNNFDLFFAKNSALWVLSGNGIYVVNEKKLLSDSIPEYTFYNIMEGMPSMTTANSQNYIDNDGNLYISGSSNVFRTNINQSDQSTQRMKLAVPYVEVDNKIVYIQNGKELVIPSNCKRLTIHGYVLSYSLLDPEVEYCLKGFDDQFDSTTKSDFGPICFTNLKGGSYSFCLTVHNADGSINNELKIPIQ
jgi:energy-coupling factor transport system substrate-specific component